MRMKKTVCYIDKKGQYRNRKYSLEYCHLIYRDCEYTQCPLWVAVSTDRRNTLFKTFGWCFEV
jgi:hypothetical protein